MVSVSPKRGVTAQTPYSVQQHYDICNRKLFFIWKVVPSMLLNRSLAFGFGISSDNMMGKTIIIVVLLESPSNMVEG